MLSVLFEGCKVLTDVVPLFSSSMPEVSDNGNSGILAFVLVDGLKVMPGCMGGRTMLDVDKRFISDILGNKMLSVVIILFPVVMSNWIVIPTQLWNFSANIRFNLAQREEQHHVDTPGNPIGTSESVAGEFSDGALTSFD